jgi:hypothetical protein
MSNAMLLLHQFLNMFWIMLIGAGTASLAIYFIDMSVLANLVVALVLYIVIIAMCLLSFWEEKSARNVSEPFLIPILRISHPWLQNNVANKKFVQFSKIGLAP